jgi:hypothetical protein
MRISIRISVIVSLSIHSIFGLLPFRQRKLDAWGTATNVIDEYYSFVDQRRYFALAAIVYKG